MYIYIYLYLYLFISYKLANKPGRYFHRFEHCPK